MPTSKNHLIDPSSPPLLTELQVAVRLNLSVATIRRWRLMNLGPRFIKVSNSAVRYSQGDVETYLEGRPSGGSEPERPR
jgi:predicted DNA-binding transcriptional regulator AlpA